MEIQKLKAGFGPLSDILPGSPPLEVLTPKLEPDLAERREKRQSTLARDSAPVTGLGDVSDY